MTPTKQQAGDDILVFKTKTFTLMAKYARILLGLPRFYVPSIFLAISTTFWVYFLVHFVRSLRLTSNVLAFKDLFNLASVYPLLQSCFVFSIRFKDFTKLTRKLDSFEEYNNPEDLERFDRSLFAHLSSILRACLIVLCLISGVFCFDIIGLRRHESAIYVIVLKVTAIFILCYGILTHVLFAAFYVICSESIIFRISSLRSVLSKVDFGNRRRAEEQLKTCVLFHGRILRLHKEFNSYWGVLINTSNLLYVITLSVPAAMFLMKPSIEEPVVLIFWGTSAFIKHYIGQRLIDFSSSLADVAYDLNWYDGDVSHRKELLIVMAVAQAPLKHELSGFGEMSNNSLSRVLAKTYSFLNLLLNLGARN